MKIGARVSTSDGSSKAEGGGQEIGGEALQIFGSSPQSRAFREVSNDKVAAFRQNSGSRRVCGSGADRQRVGAPE